MISAIEMSKKAVGCILRRKNQNDDAKKSVVACTLEADLLQSTNGNDKVIVIVDIRRIQAFLVQSQKMFTRYNVNKYVLQVTINERSTKPWETQTRNKEEIPSHAKAVGQHLTDEYTREIYSVRLV